MRWIPAHELREHHVLEFQGISEAGAFDGIPVDKVTRRRNGKIEVDVTNVDGTRRHKTFAPGEMVAIKTDD